MNIIDNLLGRTRAPRTPTPLEAGLRLASESKLSRAQRKVLQGLSRRQFESILANWGKTLQAQTYVGQRQVFAGGAVVGQVPVYYVGLDKTGKTAAALKADLEIENEITRRVRETQMATRGLGALSGLGAVSGAEIDAMIADATERNEQARADALGEAA